MPLAFDINIEPDSLLARCYLGQAFVEAGNVELAQLQLSEIRQGGGRSTWPEMQLHMAIQFGQGYSY
ncbi:hypothetical protein [Marivita hallyeonensis]|uniref:hypothetical protein n=1 Tax=Marivita hallyeonensis TaxID=996342 RepID=UPI00093448F4|nr:hypothetical protein [Marivita hallyeonensis]